MLLDVAPSYIPSVTYKPRCSHLIELIPTLQALIDAAHGLGIVVLLDVVHSHISSNADDGLAGFDLGQPASEGYFCTGEAGYHKQWDSRLFNYANWEVGYVSHT